jgi:hypothetical protein
MRCFFNLIDAHQSILDTDGVDLVGIEELRAEVGKAIAETRGTDPVAARHWKGWRLEVTDASGVVLFAVELDPLQPDTLVGLPWSALALLKFCVFPDPLLIA